MLFGLQNKLAVPYTVMRTLLLLCHSKELSVTRILSQQLGSFMLLKPLGVIFFVVLVGVVKDCGLEQHTEISLVWECKGGGSVYWDVRCSQ